MKNEIQPAELEKVDEIDLCTPPTVFQYYKGLQNRRIILNGEINSDIVERVIVPLMDMDNDGTGEPIEIILSSLGGSVYDGFVLADIIDRLKTPATIIVMGYAFSMSSIILMAGYNNPNVKKVCYPSSIALIHAGYAYIDGDAAFVRDTFMFNQRIGERMRDYVLTHSKVTEEEFNKMERCEWYLFSEDMLRLGLVDEVL